MARRPTPHRHSGAPGGELEESRGDAAAARAPRYPGKRATRRGSGLRRERITVRAKSHTGLQRLVEIRREVRDVLDADGDPHEARA